MPIDWDMMLQLRQDYEHVITCEEYNIVGVFSSAVAEVMAKMYVPIWHTMCVGFNDQYSVFVED